MPVVLVLKLDVQKGTSEGEMIYHCVSCLYYLNWVQTGEFRNVWTPLKNIIFCNIIRLYFPSFILKRNPYQNRALDIEDYIFERKQARDKNEGETVFVS